MNGGGFSKPGGLTPLPALPPFDMTARARFPLAPLLAAIAAPAARRAPRRDPCIKEAA
jgi:hypothetical protein